MGLYNQFKEHWKNDDGVHRALWRERLISWRREDVTVKLDKPTRLDRARALGYKAKPGFFVVRQRVKSGGHKRPQWAGGRKSKNSQRRMMLRKNYRVICEERTAKKFPNCEVLNSYFVAKDGKNYWYEVIMADRSHPSIVKDDRYSWVSRPANRGRAFRLLTSAGRKVRGLFKKGEGAEKVRPSRRANNRRL